MTTDPQSSAQSEQTPSAEHAAREREERALAESIERWPELGAAAAALACAGDEQLARRVADRLASLSRLGLIDGGDAPALFAERYRIERVLGRGGMGVVYLAFDERSSRRVALKVAHAPLAIDAGDVSAQRARARFEREFRAVARLEHRAIVGVLDFGEHEGRPYFTMEYVEGVTLARVAAELDARGLDPTQLSGEELRKLVRELARGDRGRQDEVSARPESWGRNYVETLCRWTIEIADALDHAHAHGVVHRDVKPSNVLVQPDGRARLFDLGLARLDDQPALTRTGDFAGSPFYAAPEQLEGSASAVDWRCDIYSLGVSLYELLALRRPFDGANAQQVFRRVARGEHAPLRRIRPAAPRDLEVVCSTAMERDPAARYASMREFAADLRRFLEFQPVLARPAGPMRRVWRYARRRPAVATAAALAALWLTGLPIGLFLANRAIRSEQSLAQLEAQRKSAVTQFFVDHFGLAEDERRRGGTVSARELLDRAVARLEFEFEHDPSVRAELLAATGAVYANLGLYERAVSQLDRALALRQSASAPDEVQVATTLEALARAHVELGRSEVARRMCERAFALLDDRVHEHSALAARLQLTISDAARGLGELAASAQALDAAATHLARVDRSDERELAGLERRRAKLALLAGDLGAAQRAFDAALERAGRAWSPHVATLEALLEEAAEVDEQLGDTRSAADRRERARALASVQLDSHRPASLPFVADEPWRAEFEELSQRGITALQARDLPAASAAFERCAELDASDPVCAYNLACARSLAGDVERGIEALERSASLGFGWDPARVRVAESDPDIELLRADPRGARLLSELRRQQARAEAATSASVHVDASLGGAAPLLVVLHASGGSARATAAGPWLEVARELGAHLLAPCGPVPVGPSSEARAWFRRAAELTGELTPEQRRVLGEIERVLAEQAIDRERVWIAGEGASAMLAFELAVRNPGLFKAVVLADGPLHPGYSPGRVRRAAAVGLRVLALVGARTLEFSRVSDPDALAREVSAWLDAYAFAGWSEGPSVRVLQRADDLHALVAARLAQPAR